MPIRPELRKFYSGPGWEAVRLRILVRAKHRCEQCLKRNHYRILTRCSGGRMWWSYTGTVWRDQAGRKTAAPPVPRQRRIRTVLTIAHLNHVPGDDRDENLKALCQWCHLNYDRLHHKQSRSKRKDAARPLLQEAGR